MGKLRGGKGEVKGRRKTFSLHTHTHTHTHTHF